MISVINQPSGIALIEEPMKLEQKGLLLVDFCAPWCDVCQVTWSLTEGLVEYYQGHMKLRHVDVDEYPELAARYQVRTVPTLVLLKDGDVVGRFVGTVIREKVCTAVDGVLEGG